MKKYKELNLYQSYCRQNQSVNVHGILHAPWFTPLLVLLACVLVWIGMGIYEGQLKNQLRELNDWMAQPEIVALHEEVEEQKLRSAELRSQQAEVDELTANVATYPELNSALLRKISAVGGSEVSLVINGYEATTGSLFFEARSKKVIDIPDYVQKQKDTGLYSSVLYTGYAYDETEYVLSLACMLQGQKTAAEEEGTT